MGAALIVSRDILGQGILLLDFDDLPSKILPLANQ
jgi:hypothetical protein